MARALRAEPSALAAAAAAAAAAVAMADKISPAVAVVSLYSALHSAPSARRAVLRVTADEIS